MKKFFCDVCGKECGYPKITVKGIIQRTKKDVLLFDHSLDFCSFECLYTALENKENWMNPV